MHNLFRKIPAVDRLLADPGIKQAAAGLSRLEVTAVIRQELEKIRREIAHNEENLSEEAITARVAQELRHCKLRRFQPVINATGV